MNSYTKLAALATATAALAFTAVPVFAEVTTVVVHPEDMATSFADVVENPTSWFFYNDETDTIDNSLGAFVSGPAVPPLGNDSVQLTVVGTQRRNLATYQFAGVKLADVTELKFSTYNTSIDNGGSADRSAYLNFNVDFNGSDTWQKRLAFVPRVNGVVVQDSWQEWDALSGGTALWWWSGFASNGNMWPDGNTNEYRTWNDLVTSFPNLAVRTTDPWLGLRVGEPYADGYTENLDAFKFGVNGVTTVFDFEKGIPLVGPPTDKNACKLNGWASFNNPVFKNQGECVSFVVSHKAQ